MGLSASRSARYDDAPAAAGEEDPVLVVHDVERPSAAQRRVLVVYVAGDLQDVDEAAMLENLRAAPAGGVADDERAAVKRAAARHGLADTAARLAAKHGAARCVALRARALVGGALARYDSFCPRCRPDGYVPAYALGAGGEAVACARLGAALDRAAAAAPRGGGRRRGWERSELEIVAFSR